MKFINRNAYILVAVKGYTFCGGALRAIKLIILNVGRLAAVNVIGDALIFLGKLTVVMACGSLAFLMSDLPPYSRVDSEHYVASPIVPVILTMVAAWMVASVFFAVRDSAPSCERTRHHSQLCADSHGKK
jgi:solute carrier family 44 (choline transporter-like protein), member 2/4/5